MLKIKKIKLKDNTKTCYDCSGQAKFQIKIVTETDNLGDWASCEICYLFNAYTIKKYKRKKYFFIPLKSKDSILNCDICNKLLDNLYYLSTRYYTFSHGNKDMGCCFDPKCIEYVNLLLC